MSGDYSNVVAAAAQKYGVDPALALGVYGQESSAGQNAGTSTAGARGQMQLEPGTASDYGVTNIDDPHQNIDAGVHYLADQLNAHGGSVPLALASYNAGPGNVKRYGGVPPFPETQAYVRNVMARAGYDTGAPMAALNPQIEAAAGIAPLDIRSDAPPPSPPGAPQTGPVQAPSQAELDAAFKAQHAALNPQIGAAANGAPSQKDLDAAFAAQHPQLHAGPAPGGATGPTAARLAADKDARQHVAEAGNAGFAIRNILNSASANLEPTIAGATAAAANVGQSALAGLHVPGVSAPAYGPGDAFGATQLAQQQANAAYHQAAPISALAGDIAGMISPAGAAEKLGVSALERLAPTVAKAATKGGAAARVATRAAALAGYTGAGDFADNVQSGQSLGDSAGHAAQTAAASVPLSLLGEALPHIAPKLPTPAKIVALPAAGALGGAALGATGAALTGHDVAQGALGGAENGGLVGTFAATHRLAARGINPSAADHGVALDVLDQHLNENGNPDLVGHGQTPTALAVGPSAADLASQAASEGGQGGAPVRQAVEAYTHPTAASPRVLDAANDTLGVDLPTLNARADAKQAELEAAPTSGQNQQAALSEAQSPDNLRSLMRAHVENATGIDAATAAQDTEAALEAQRKAAGAQYDNLPELDQGVNSERAQQLAQDPSVALALKQAQANLRVRNLAEPGMHPQGEAPNPDHVPATPMPGAGGRISAADFNRLASDQGVVKPGAGGNPTIDPTKIDPAALDRVQGGNGQPETIPTGHAWQEAASILGKQGSRLTDPGAYRDAQIRYNAVRSVLDEAVPGLREARSGYADAFKARDAYERGKDLMGSGKTESAGEITERLKSATPEERRHEARGLVSEINRRMESGQLKPEHITGNERVQAALKGTIGEAATERLNRGLNDVANLRDQRVSKETPDQQFKRGRDEGRGFWSSPRDEASFTQAIEGKSAHEKAAVAAGYLGEFARRLELGGRDARQALEKITSDVHQGALKALVGPEKAAALKAMAERELAHQDNAAKIVQASAGTPSPHHEDNAALGAVLGAAEKGGGLGQTLHGAAAGFGVNQLQKLTALLRSGKLSPGVRTSLGRILAQPAELTARQLEQRRGARSNMKLSQSALSELYRAAKPGVISAAARGGGSALAGLYAPSPQGTE